MVEAWDEQLMWAKYHLSTSQRLYENFSNYETKRFLSGCLTEMALSATGLVNTILLFASQKKGLTISKDSKKRIKQFTRVCEKDLTDINSESVLKIFEIKSAQKHSPVEMLRKDKILLLDNGEYKAITKKRIGSLIALLEENIKVFEKQLPLL